ncbi:N-acetyltransferase [Acinetobacter sp. LoGeW2-3]|uniref:N-acetyltransferase n=1 Tax=Acinetobacter sp. LoGeW2-3 TaxID=1808001 RepID=UPI000C0582B9|nr:N-acetyltransferase [Acinetobacter sp. LoGeW2-3]ATO18294.1 N-acetyltransferase [Acinetobacter sp. LoGeW2-3]
MTIIQKAEMDDINSMLEIWLKASLKAHDFIPADYWKNQLIPMRDIYLPLAENYVIKEQNTVRGFASLLRKKNVLAALFIAPEQQGIGYGQRLVDFLKQQCDQLHLNVYDANTSAVSFYQKQGFKIINQGVDENTGHAELSMSWFKP